MLKYSNGDQIAKQQCGALGDQVLFLKNCSEIIVYSTRNR